MLYIIGLIAILVFLYFLCGSSFGTKLKEWLKNRKNSLEAKFLDKSRVHVNERMHQRKSALIHDGLCKIKGEIGRPLTVLEIGAGAGANFDFYPDGTKVICVEPNDKTEPYLRKNAANFPKVLLEKVHIGCAENMDHIDSNSIDAVVSTLVMCRVKDIHQCFKEVIRVLKPNGKFIFLEHVSSRNHHSLHAWAQLLLRWPVKYFMGSRIAHDTEADIRRANFSSVDVEYFEVQETHSHNSPLHLLSRLHAKCHIAGVATK